jgi:hypothetical protein
VPDALTMRSDGSENLGYAVGTAGQTFTLNGVADPSTAAAAIVTFNWFDGTHTVPSVSVNDQAPIATAWPFGSDYSVWRTIAVPVPLGALVAGTNTLTLSSSTTVAIANIDLILAGAGGTVGPTPTPTATPSPSPTPAPIDCPQLVISGPDGSGGTLAYCGG